MKAVIHKGRNYTDTLRTVQNKRMQYICRELSALDSETLSLLQERLTDISLPVHWQSVEIRVYNSDKHKAKEFQTEMS